MATAFGGEDTRSYSWGKGKTRGWVEVTVKNKSDTVATVTVRAQVQSVSPYYMRYYGARVYAGVYNSGSSGSWTSSSKGTWLYDDEWSPITPVSYSKDFARKASSYSATGFCYYKGEEVSGYGAMSNTGEVGLSVTIPALPVYAPKAVTGIWSRRDSDGQNAVGWGNNTDTTHPYSSIKVERSVDYGGFAEIASVSAGATSYIDTATSAGHLYQYRVRPQNSAGYGAYSTTGYTYNTPPDCSNCANTRNTDNKNTVSWSLGTSVSGLYSSILVERLMDGGAWSQIASLAGSAASYADTSTTVNHSYRYRVRAYNPAGYSGYAYSGTTYNTPSAPTSVSVARSTETVVAITIANPASTATALELQRSSDAENWVPIRTIEGTIASCQDTPGGGTWYYRARNTRGSLASAWSPASNAVVTIIAPAAPTLIEPASGVTISKSRETIAFKWKHNPIDGSAQTAAQLQVSTDGGSTWDTTQATGEAQEVPVANSFAVNSTVTWRVRTKGAHADYGAYSATRVFTVAQEPSVVFNAPASGAVIENTPIQIELMYSDVSGSLVSASLKVLHGDAVVYSRDMGTATSAEIKASDFLPTNGEAYTFAVDVRSTSTLQASATRDVTVDFVPPMDGDLLVKPDPETGYVSIMATVVQDDEKVESDHLSVYRVSNSKRKLIGDNLKSGASIMDRNAPLNKGFSYEVVSFADSGVYSTVSVASRIDSPFFFFYWGDGIAKARWEPQGEKTLARPAKKRVYYAGRKYPVSYDSKHMSDERSLSAVLLEDSEADSFERLIEDGGRCVYKNGRGEVIRCDVEATLTPDWTVPTYYGSVSLSIVRIDGGDL